MIAHLVRDDATVETLTRVPYIATLFYRTETARDGHFWRRQYEFVKRTPQGLVYVETGREPIP